MENNVPDNTKIAAGWMIMILVGFCGYLGYGYSDGALLPSLLGGLVGLGLSRFAIIFLLPNIVNAEVIDVYVFYIYVIDFIFMVGSFIWWDRIREDEKLFGRLTPLVIILAVLTVLGNFAKARVRRKA